jgi:hypothetical protein
METTKSKMKWLYQTYQHVITWHGSTGEKVVSHPSVLKIVCEILVRENVDKQLSFGFQEIVNLLHKHRVVFHVFKPTTRYQNCQPGCFAHEKQ